MASAPYYLQIDQIPGQSKEKGHEGWIPIRRREIVLANRYYFVAFQDQSLVLLLQRSRDGQYIARAALDQTDDPKKPSREATFTDVRVTEFMSFDGGFEFTLEAASVQFPLGIAPQVQHRRRGDGSLDGPIRPRWPGVQHD